MKRNANFVSLKERWPSSLVSRDKILEFSGGTIHPRTIANLDALGQGPKERLRIGKKVVYHVDSLIKWLEERSEILDSED